MPSTSAATTAARFSVLSRFILDNILARPRILAAIFDGHGAGQFLGTTVHDVRDQGEVPYDLLFVATLEPPDAVVTELIAAGVAPEKLITLRPHPSDKRHRT